MRKTNSHRKRRAFTLVELLVVVSIIALLISILLPSLKKARGLAKQASCGALQRGLGTGLQTYFAENNDWIPGWNTTGWNLWLSTSTGQLSDSTPLSDLDKSYLPVSTYDWITPLLTFETALPRTRLERFILASTEYKCAAQNQKSALYDKAKPPEGSGAWEATAPLTARSFLMPVYFQLYGDQDRVDAGRTYHPRIKIRRFHKSPSPNWSVDMRRYVPRVGRVGAPAEKIAFADGTRYVDSTRVLTFNPDVDGTYFGDFTSSGGWWSGSIAYGPEGKGKGANVKISYRHANKINALFFDNHVETIGNNQSRKIDYWYPKGGVIRPGKAAQGMTNYATYVDGTVIR